MSAFSGYRRCTSMGRSYAAQRIPARVTPKPRRSRRHVARIGGTQPLRRRCARRPSRSPARPRCTSSPGRSGRRAAQLVDEHRHQPRAAHPERMPERDRAAVDVDLLGIQAELVDARDRLAGERLVELDEVEVVDAEPGPRERLAGGRHGPEAHDRRVDAGDGGRHDPRHRPEARVARPLASTSEDRRRAVVDPGAVARGHGAALAERRPELARAPRWSVSARGCSSRSTTIGVALLLRDRDRDDLVVEPAGLDAATARCCDASANASCARAIDRPALGDVLGGLAHRVRVVHRRQLRIDEPPAERRVLELARAAIARGLGLGHHVRRAGHRLDAAGDEHVAVAGRDRVGGRLIACRPSRTAG